MKHNWEYKRLGDVCSIVGRIGFRGYTRADIVEKGSGAISFSPSNIDSNQLKFDNLTYISWDKYYESPEIMAEIGDILFTKTASVGKCAIIKDLPQKATINPQLVLLKLIQSNNQYLTYALQDSNFQLEVQKKEEVHRFLLFHKRHLAIYRFLFRRLRFRKGLWRNWMR